MGKTTSKKIIAALAVVGTAAAVVAMLSIKADDMNQGLRFLEEDPDQETIGEFQKFISKYRRNFAT